MHRWADDLIEIADDPNLDPLDKRVRVDTRKWLMGKLAPASFGDRLTIEGGPNLAAIGAVPLSEMSDAELDALEHLALLRLAETGKVLDDGQAGSNEEPSGTDSEGRSVE